jgi:hypothetical protein
MADPAPNLRLMVAQPKEFNKREIGERRIAGESKQAFGPDSFRQLSCLGGTTLIAPDDRRPQHLAPVS